MSLETLNAASNLSTIILWMSLIGFTIAVSYLWHRNSKCENTLESLTKEIEENGEKVQNKLNDIREELIAAMQEALAHTLDHFTQLERTNQLIASEFENKIKDPIFQKLDLVLTSRSDEDISKEIAEIVISDFEKKYNDLALAHSNIMELVADVSSQIQRVAKEFEDTKLLPQQIVRMFSKLDEIQRLQERIETLIEKLFEFEKTISLYTLRGGFRNIPREAETRIKNKINGLED